MEAGWWYNAAKMKDVICTVRYKCFALYTIKIFMKLKSYILFEHRVSLTFS